MFVGNAMQLIDLCPAEKVLVTDSLPLPENPSPKVIQLPMAPMIAKIIESSLNQIDEAAENTAMFSDINNDSEDLELN